MKKSKKKGPTDLATNTAFLITEVARLYRTSFDKEMKALGLNRSQWLLISYLCYFDGSIQQELAEVMDIGKAGMGKMIDRMEKDKLVVRMADRVDRRLNRVRLTNFAKPLAKTVNLISDETIERSLSQLQASEVVTLNELLLRIKETIEVF